MTGVTCLYDELNEFKSSAAVAAGETARGITNSCGGLKQDLTDNFHAIISS